MLACWLDPDAGGAVKVRIYFNVILVPLAGREYVARPESFVRIRLLSPPPVPSPTGRGNQSLFFVRGSATP